MEVDAKYRRLVSTRRGASIASLAALVLLATVPLGSAFGWGAEGHRIAGLVADHFLEPHTRSALDELTGGTALADVGLWLDQNRDWLRDQRPGSERWHFDNQPVCSADPGYGAYCSDGNCASGAFPAFLAILRNRGAQPADRLFALRVVVHVLEDIHQPLHVADNDDRGANRLIVDVGRRGREKSLHAAWDVDFVKRAARGEREAEFAAELIAEFGADRARIAAGDFTAWRTESHALASRYAYGELPAFACGVREPESIALPREYLDDAARIVREQLARAGIRLAAVLNQTL